EVNVFFRLFSFEKKQLRHDQVGNLIVDWGTEENDVVFQQSRINIKRALAPRRLLDHHWYQCHILDFSSQVLRSQKNQEAISGRQQAEKTFKRFNLNPDYCFSSFHSSSITFAFATKKSSALRLRNLGAMLRSPPCFVKTSRTCCGVCREPSAIALISSSIS